MRSRRILGKFMPAQFLGRVDECKTIPTYLQDRYFAFGIFSTIDCVSLNTHDIPSKHCLRCLASDLNPVDALAHVLDGSLTHVMDDNQDFDDGELVYRREYRVDWDKRVVHVSGPMPGKMTVALEKMNAQWTEGCQAVNEAFA